MGNPVAQVTDTYFSVLDSHVFVGDRAAHEAIQEWVKKHGIDPRQISAYGPIHRDEEHCRVVYVGKDDWSNDALRGCWTTCVQQGETPPLPWPGELDRYR
jgi:hypothetical protein